MLTARQLGDMIYGHLGTLQSARQHSKLKQMVRVDYEQSVSDLYTQVAGYVISAQGYVDILAHVEDRPLESWTGLPSWVPDCT
jgi:hypothetical protein